MVITINIACITFIITIMDLNSLDSLNIKIILKKK